MLIPAKNACHIDHDRLDNYFDKKVGVLIIAQDTGRILTGLRSELVDDKNTHSIFGGSMDNAEDYTEAAHREVFEETGFTLFNEIRPLAYFEKNDSVYTTMITFIPKEAEPELNWEHNEASWLTLDELSKLNPLHYGLKALIDNNDVKAEIREISQYYQNKTNENSINNDTLSLSR